MKNKYIKITIFYLTSLILSIILIFTLFLFEYERLHNENNIKNDHEIITLKLNNINVIVTNNIYYANIWKILNNKNETKTINIKNSNFFILNNN